ncbi:UNVERIFIED_CONTAM: hypothetical protein GTU68_007805 [Idotea baltica]|nr:hypothetical protein [Idotea baltica]
MSILIECVPNFSEGRDQSVIDQICEAISKIDGVQLLDVDPGAATNRTVVTFVGHPDQVIEAAYQGIKMAAQLIDMSTHSGEHPRMGATDVCPLIPISNISMEETARYAHLLAERVGQDLDIPIYMYESAATQLERKNLATVRAGEYEGLSERFNQPKWAPDYGPVKFNKRSGATAIGARDFLIAYNVNLNTTSVRRANAIAFDVREQGRIVTKKGACKSVKGIGWYIEEYGIAQISMNLTNIADTTLHQAYEACYESANRRGIRVTGSELIGLVPKKVMLDAGRFYLQQQKRSAGIPEREIIKIAVKSMGLDELKPFDPDQKIIEYVLENKSKRPLIHASLMDFIDQTSSESPAPGGGSVSATVGSLGVALATMVANLSSHKRGWDRKWNLYSDYAEQGEQLKYKLAMLIDEDTQAFNYIMDAFRLPKKSTADVKHRSAAIQDATKNAMLVPFQILETCVESMDLIKAMADIGNPNSVSDAGVGALCARAAARGAFMNVKINAADLSDEAFKSDLIERGQKLIDKAQLMENEIIKLVEAKL